ncbi:TonB-dependent receptor [Phenylobacterium immobile]|uniref:TonB-dependent receptor n=1 Tax=Phenylobacterium immobile TaxID=21 RepID=UPI000B2074F1|nr:TonB-dependent receptor [Phenylobacterium immobile]
MSKRIASAVFGACVVLIAGQARAQRAEENAARAAGDAFGTNIGNERVGLYTQTDVRGFSPATAGNLRLEGMAFDFRLPPPPRLAAGSQVRVGLAAQAYPFPAPTGVVDYFLRPTDRDYASSLIQVGPHDAYIIEFEQGLYLAPGRFGMNWAMSLKRDDELVGDHIDNWGVAANARWRPTDRVEVKPYYAFYQRLNKPGVTQVFVGGSQLPEVMGARNFLPDWTRQNFQGFQTGVITTTTLTKAWTLRAGFQVFHIPDEGPMSDSFLNTNAEGVAQQRRIADQPDNHSNSNSGEARLTGQFRNFGLDQIVHLDFRARDVDRSFGGAAQVNFTNVPIGRYNAPVAEPNWTYARQPHEFIQQSSFAGSYLVGRAGLGNIGVGVQKVDYTKTISTPGRTDIVAVDKPLFWSGTALFTPRSNIAIYAAYVEGLEEAPIAPEAAINAQEAAPAIHTNQKELGVRYAITPQLRLVAGWFDIRKPYINLDSGRLWRELGVERHHGYEFSLTGQVLTGMNIVAGFVHMKPVVTGEAVAAGLIGPEPVGQARDSGRMNIDFRRTPASKASFEGSLTYFGSRAASARVFAVLDGKQPQAPAYVTLDLGARYRFAILGRRSTLRLQALNVLNARNWVVATSGGMTVNPERRFALSLATDY